ncbi:MAG: Mur ligase family protein [bacterium]|nr:Mur ligase family protein [bacterium]
MAQTPHNFKPYYAAIRYLERLASSQHDQAYMHNRSNHPAQYVERTAELVRRLGNPCQGSRIIHVAGTAGKGTTTAYLHNILHGAGFRVGSFTSPYATTSIEKIKVDDLLIDPLVFAKLVGRIKPVIAAMGKEYEYGRPSYFEIFFAISLLYFQKMRCEYIVLEVGCGGRYDAGMIFPKAISAITNIGLDHTHLLGKTLPKIAKEKAGIIRKNSHVFTTEKRASILTLFKKIAKEKNTRMHVVRERVYSPQIHPGNAQASYASPGAGCSAEFEANILAPANSSTFQNASLAAAVAAHLKIKDSIINQAISNTSLPCRFETIQQHPLVILDGGHNPLKIASVVHNTKQLTYGRLYTMFGCSSAKDAPRMVQQLAAITDAFVFTKPKGAGHTFYDPKALARLAPRVKKQVVPDPKKALAVALKKLGPKDALLITGSFYLAGELRKRWISEETVLTFRNHV